jgi:CBS domain containing-hemolysin-like protein
MSWQVAVLVTIALLLLSGFFVASEFALVGARRHRLEQARSAGRRGARSALAGVRELSLMLAGAQLGITMCIIGLGMISEPAFHHLLEPPLSALGLPQSVADVVALVIALAVVTYLHVVVGEMAPKSWAIAHPERSALLLAPAFRAFTWVSRWLLIVLNGMSNGLVRLLGVTPRNEIVHVRNREQIHHLVEESERLGLITDEDRGLLTRALDAPASPVATVVVPTDRIVGVRAEMLPEQVIDVAAANDRTRLVVWQPDGSVVGVVHIRDALLARAAGEQRLAHELASPIPEFTADVDLASAVDLLQQRRAQLGLVRSAEGAIAGLITLDDLLARVLTEPR